MNINVVFHLVELVQEMNIERNIYPAGISLKPSVMQSCPICVKIPMPIIQTQSVPVGNTKLLIRNGKDIGIETRGK